MLLFAGLFLYALPQDGRLLRFPTPPSYTTSPIASAFSFMSLCQLGFLSDILD
ncbi:MAG: hypothetical protein GY820_38110 [Gammaproteobacteria bacterium]|nr:hypothetical protein [Gammaproteobacteria bacterium]